MTRHHILPRSQWWSDDYYNIKMLKWNKHNALHTIFDNDTPREQLIRLLCNINATALTAEFQNDILKILQETDHNYYYKNGILLPNKIRW